MMVKGHNLTFLINLLPKTQIKTSPLIFWEIWTSKMPSNGRWLRWIVLLEDKGGVYISETSPVVVIIQPPVQMLHLHWWLSYDNRLWKSIFTGGCHKGNRRLWKWISTGSYKVVAHPFLYIAGPKVKPSVKKMDRRLRALFY
jgi:hypothetical protein